MSYVQQPNSAGAIPSRSRLQFVYVDVANGVSTVPRQLIRSHAASDHSIQESHEARLARLPAQRAAARARLRADNKLQQQEEERACQSQDLLDVQDDGSACVEVSYDRVWRGQGAGLTAGETSLPTDSDILLDAELCTRQVMSFPIPISSSRLISLIDPFDSLPVKITTRWMDSILHNFFARWIRKAPEVKWAGRPSGYTARHWLEIQSTPSTLSSSLLLNAGVLALVRKQATDSPDILGLKSRTLDLINTRTQSGDCSDGVLLSVITLRNFEAICGKKEDVVAHNLGLLQLVTCRGGLDELEPDLKSVILFEDKSIALSAQTRRLFPEHEDDDVYMLEQHHITFNVAQVLQPGFSALGAKSLDPGLLTPLLQLQHLVDALEVSLPSNAQAVHRCHWIATESMLDVTTLMDFFGYVNRRFPLNGESSDSSQSQYYDMSEMVRLTGVTLLHHLRERCLFDVSRRLSNTNNIASITEHIRPLSLDSHFELWFSHKMEEARTLWWIYCVVGIASTKPQRRLLELLQVMRRKLNLTEKRHSLAMLKGVIFPVVILDSDHERLWSWLMLYD